ncbi:MAG: sterol desaturase family protein [Acidimicrobiales bacterium]
MTAILLVIASFGVMELVSYAGHRWVMHGSGMGWHRSHHAPPLGRVERNDLFPLCFSVVGVGLFAAASTGLAGWLWWVAIGVTAYGACYLFVHEVYIHHRLPVPTPPLRYLEWVRSAHGDHHRRGGEPFGMLLPFARDRAHTPDQVDLLERSAERRRSRATRSRL